MRILLLEDDAQLGDWVASGLRDGDFSNWDASWSFALANEMTMNRDWLGEIHLVAVYSEALSAAQISRNYEAGP